MKLRTVKGKLIAVDGKLCTANFEYIYLWGSYIIENGIHWGNSFRIDNGKYKIMYYSGAICYEIWDDNLQNWSELKWCVDRCYNAIRSTDSFDRVPLPGVSGTYQSKAEAEAAATGAESIITITNSTIMPFFDRPQNTFSGSLGGEIYYKLVRIA